jgi:hypothetical protein
LGRSQVRIQIILKKSFSLALLVRFSTGRFIHEYHPTLGELPNIIASVTRTELSELKIINFYVINLFVTLRTTKRVNLCMVYKLHMIASSAFVEFNCETTSVIDEEIAELKIFDTANTVRLYD